MFDVFYKGPKPNLFAFEKPAESLEDAARQCKTEYYWYIYGNNNYSQFNFDFVPPPWQGDYIHTWPNQWQRDGEVYLAKKVNNGQHHYHDQIVQRLAVEAYWKYDKSVDLTSIDRNWCPDHMDPPYIYVFGNQWNTAMAETSATYTIPGATQKKYMMEMPVRVLAEMENYTVLDDVEFDFTWRPNPNDPPYIYVFGNQWYTPEQRASVKYTVPGATEIKYMSYPQSVCKPNKNLFNSLTACEFDYSWEPDPGEPPYKYVFGNQWWGAEIMPTVEYEVAGWSEVKYMDALVATLPAHDNWNILIDCEFDRSWVPDPGDPPFIYVFGNQWYPAEVMPTVEYHVQGATERKYVSYMTPRLLANRTNWEITEHIVTESIDYSWVPHPNDDPFVHHFADEYSLSAGVIYRVPGAVTDKFAGPIPLVRNDAPAVKTLEIFFIDRGNAKSPVRFDILSAKHTITKVRYANSLFETIQRCVNRVKGTKFWIISSDYNYEDFDFNWHPEHWQQFMTHVFPSQHNKWSDTFLINKHEFERHAKWATSLEQFPNLNFVTDQTVEKLESTADIYYVDHGNPESDNNYNYLKVAVGEVIRTRFVGEYLDVLKRIANNAETEYVWVISSLCKYNYFDFTWGPEPWQREMIHCFRSEGEKRGDTFYIHVESFKKQMVELELLDWFNVINYVENSFVERYVMPIHVYAGDDLITEIKNYDFKTPYVTFTNQPNLRLILNNCLWSAKDRTVVRATRSGATCIVPRDIKQHLKTQIYDYPYLDKGYYVSEYYENKSHPGIDIVYISNGEPDEEKWYDTLCYVSNSTGSEIKWIRGVNGRTAAYQAAAHASTTPWFFAVFAKIEVDVHFPWLDWMPDYWQEPKHYIFNARNPVNGLEYGHMSVIAYNKRLVLENNAPGIDFTLSQPHESVPILSGTAHFNQDPWMTWRTAFREVIKLKHFDATAPTLENSHRLDVWCTQAKGKYSDYCLAGARDAVAYYNEVGGDYEQLKLSFEWAWLRTRFEAVKLRYGI